MPQQDTTPIKEKIFRFLVNKGPSLPVHVARESQQSMLFASAFLSELISDKKIKTSSMKVGGSPLYLLPGQENKLENFSHHLKSKEREAFDLIKGKKILKDSKQEPAIRVALREIKDFAIPFRNNEELYWRYLTITEDEVRKIFNEEKETNQIIEKDEVEKESPKEIPAQEIVIQEEIVEDLQKEEPNPIIELKPKKEIINIFEKEEKEIPKQIQKKEKAPKQKQKNSNKSKKKSPKKQDEKFFNKVKEYLNKQEIELIDIIGLTKNTLSLKVKENDEEYLIVAFNKKRISEREIIEANKRAKEENLNYKVLSFGDPPKSLLNLIEAIKGMTEIKKID